MVFVSRLLRPRSLITCRFTVLVKIIFLLEVRIRQATKESSIQEDHSALKSTSGPQYCVAQSARGKRPECLNLQLRPLQSDSRDP
jgi:hypothetical protein